MRQSNRPVFMESICSVEEMTESHNMQLFSWAFNSFILAVISGIYSYTKLLEQLTTLWYIGSFTSGNLERGKGMNISSCHFYLEAHTHKKKNPEQMTGSSKSHFTVCTLWSSMPGSTLTEGCFTETVIQTHKKFTSANLIIFCLDYFRSLERFCWYKHR